MIPDLPDLYRPFVDAVSMVAFLVVVARLNGLRSFPKLSGFDFAVTVAIGSVLASIVVSGDTPFLSVLHGDPNGRELHDTVLHGVGRRA